MNKENIWSEEICPYFWKENAGDNSVYEQQTRKCILNQKKGWKACVYHAKEEDIKIARINNYDQK